ncbi:Nipped-B-like protein [Lamellibrachia satsuma]|nr:Nipped-B-like protein [Lamellibrachia satsuma]
MATGTNWQDQENKQHGVPISTELLTMNGEIPSVPITTLAGISSLTDLLPELPLPTPLAHTVNNTSLLYHPTIADDAKKILTNSDEDLVSQLVNALRQNNTDHIELTDTLAGDGIEGDVPALLQAIIGQDPDVFKGGPMYNSSDPGVGGRPKGGVPYYPPQSQQPSPYQAGQMSPCPPGSPARFPAQGGTNSPYNCQPTTFQPAGTRGLQSYYQNYTHQPGTNNSAPTMNGGSPGMHAPEKRGSRHNQSATSASSDQSSGRHYQAASTSEDPDSRNRNGGASSSKESDNWSEQNIELSIDSLRVLPVSPRRRRSKLSAMKGKLTTDSITVKKTSSEIHCEGQGTEGSEMGQEAMQIKDECSQGVCPGNIKTDSAVATEVGQEGVIASQAAGDLGLKETCSSKGEIQENSVQIEEVKAMTVEKMKDMMSPTIALTRIDDRKERRKHKKDAKDVKDMHYNVVTTDGEKNKLTLRIAKLKMPDEKKDRGAKRKKQEDDDYEDDLEITSVVPSSQNSKEFSMSLSERVKRRRRQVSYAEDEDSDSADTPVANGGDGDFQTPMSRKFTSRHAVIEEENGRSEGRSEEASQSEARRRRRREKKHKRTETDISVDELMDTATFKKFSSAIDNMLEAVEDVDLNELNADDDEADTSSSDVLISRGLLSDLTSESAKLKSMGVTNQVPYEKLVKVFTLLQYNIKDGYRLTPLVASHDDSGEDEQLWQEVAMERVLAAVDAGLAALSIMTAPDMPKEVFLEDVIERVVMMTKQQLQNTIFPEFDPVYKVNPKNKGAYQGNVKMKRARASNTKHKSSQLLYNKLTELVSLLSELTDIQELTDTIILQLSTLAVSPFFVENISELQLSALKLVTSLFSRYEKHRQLILEDILSSLARLPSSKKNLRSYRLNSDEQIQMVTALALELIQCVVKLPTVEEEESGKEGSAGGRRDRMDNEVVIVTSYEVSMRTAHNFLSVFLRKCSTKGEEDYRPMFENFVYDLLATVNKPEWPAAELLLSLLGRLLVQQFSNKSVDMSLRVASLDYLGIVAARLRKDAVSSRLNEEVIHEIIDQINESDDENAKEKNEERSKTPQPELEKGKTEHLQKSLLEYLAYHAQNDPALEFARQFYIAQWYRDCSVEVEKMVNRTPPKSSKAAAAAQKRRQRDEDSDEEDSNDGEDNDILDEVEKAQQVQQIAEVRKAFLLTQISTRIGTFASFKPSQSKLDYDNACLVTRYLAANRPFSQSFDIYLTQILKVLCETAVAVRTKAMKCLTAVVEADPGILAREDMQQGVHGRFLDQSTSVREAAVELVGKFILIRPELTAQYYDMLSNRILDTGISVRKRVIKIFRDICVDQPEFPKIPEMCVRMIRRVNDEEGIKKLVNDTFQSMWFTPVRDSHHNHDDRQLQRVMNITDVVTMCRDSGLDWFEQLLENLFKKEENSSNTPVEQACIQIVNCLVENVLRIEECSAEAGATCSSRLISCFNTLYLFCKVKPELLIPHANTIQPYLDIKCSTSGDYMVLHNVARILELAVPLMDHPGESFLAQLEEDMMKLVLKHGMLVLQSCVSCLGAVVNTVTHNYKLVRDCFQKFFGVLTQLMCEHQKDSNSPQLVSSRPTLLRSLYTVGLLCRHFNFDSQEFGEKKVSIRDKVFDVMLYFIRHEDEEVKHKALAGLGFFVTREYEYMLGQDMRELYIDLLTQKDAPVKMRCQVLRNMLMYLMEEEARMIKADQEWKKLQTKEDLKEMGDVQSGMASTIIQVYIKQILESFFHPHSQVRMIALSVIILILRQGLVHPVQIVPYLISMGTDNDSTIRVKADQQVQELDKKYPGFIQVKAMQGIKMSYRLQEVIQKDPSEPIRGIRTDDDNIISLNSFIYSLIRSNRSQRRAMLQSLLNMFDETGRATLSELIYMADNMAFLPYQVQDEPLYIIHQIDIIVSVSGSNILQSYKEVFFPGAADEKAKLEDDDDEELNTLLERLPEDVAPLPNLFMMSQGCILLLMLKQHLKELYKFTDSKIHRYSPTEQAKVWDKPLNRKSKMTFNPKQAMDLVGEETQDLPQDEDTKTKFIQSYLDFKQLMLSIDPDDDDDIPPTASQSGHGTPAAAGTPSGGQAAGDATEGGESQGSKSMAVIDLSGDGDASNGSHKAEIPKAPSSLMAYHKRSMSSHHRRGRQSKSSTHGGSSSSSSSKPHKHKKKKRRRHYSEDDDDEDDSEDSDYVA